MPKIISKFVFSFLSALLVLFSVAPFFSVKAQATTWYSQDFPAWYTKVADPKNPSEIFGERYTSAQVEWVIYGAFAYLINHVTSPKIGYDCFSGDSTACAADIALLFAGIKLTQVNTNQNLASLIFADRSLSGLSYLKDGVANFKLVPEAHAQQNPGFGFSAFNPIQQLWRGVRNFAYALSVLAVVILAFMIMFRVKISPQVVITAQSAIPKVIIALIFVTFSYAIAGLLVDLMYVVIGLVSLFFGPIIFGSATNVFAFMTTGLPLVGGGGALGLLAMYFSAFMGHLLFALFASGPSLGLNIALFPVLTLLWMILVVVAVIVLFFVAIKILWLLIKTLAQTYLIVIFGPIQIMLGAAFPASQALGVGPWIQSLAANLAVYPVVGTLFMLSFVFLTLSFQIAFTANPSMKLAADALNNLLGANLSGNGGWAPPLTLGESYMSLVFLGVSFVIITLIPKTAEIIQGFISGKPFAYGTAVGEALGQVAGDFGFGNGICG